jgi:Zn-dependent protease with chaperone function
MPAHASMLGRVVAALVLSVAFYVLSLALAVLLVAVPWIEWSSVHRIHVQIVVGCFAAAGAILWSIVPRRDPFEPPGPRLDPAREPRLFRFLEEVAHACGEPLPADVYLLGTVNAFVTQRGGFLARGGRRVMGLGLPLFALLTRDELSAVVAHEFGHFHGGDVQLGPWIYQTRAAIGRTVDRLQARRNVLRFPFIGYGWLFQRVTLSIARAQELAADALAARVAGVVAQTRALEKTHAFDAAHRAFWSEASSVLRAGFLPRLNEGFLICLALPAVQERAAATLAALKATDDTSATNTHPSLHRRLAALPAAPQAGARRDGGSARTLLDHEGALERALVDGIVPEKLRRSLAPIEWREVEERVTLPTLRDVAMKHPEELAGLALRDLPRAIRGLNEQYAKSTDAELRAALEAQFERLRCAAMLAYVRGGFALRSPPGDAMWLVRGATRRDVYSDADALSQGSLSEAEWSARCESDGVADVPLFAEA